MDYEFDSQQKSKPVQKQVIPCYYRYYLNKIDRKNINVSFPWRFSLVFEIYVLSASKTLSK